MILATLYKKTSHDTSQQWTISVEGDSPPEIVTVYGQVGGKMQESRVKVAAGKNLGKANATTPRQQAELEATAKWKKQLDKGYIENLDRKAMAEAVERKPMLAHPYEKYRHKIDWKKGVLCQFKLDGIRCLAHKSASGTGAGGVRLVSRGNKPIDTVPHINEALALIMDEGEVFDGELYIHGETFQNLVSYVKRAQPDSARVEYHVYDTIKEWPFELRSQNLIERLCDENSEVVLPVYTISAYSDEDVAARHAEFTALGYEGLMVRANDCLYKEGYRSADLLKIKSFQECEYRIVEVKQGKGKLEGCAVFVCETEDGERFDCLPEGTMEKRAEYWTDRNLLVGSMLTVCYFELTTSEKPVPRFPIGKAVRSYE